MTDLDRYTLILGKISTLERDNPNYKSESVKNTLIELKKELLLLYEKLKKAEEDGKKFNEMKEVFHEESPFELAILHQTLKQFKECSRCGICGMLTPEKLIDSHIELHENQKTPEDIEKIKKYERLSKMSFLFENNLLFVTPEEFKRFCRLEQDIQHREFTKEESNEYNELNFKICDCLNLFPIQEKEIQQLKEENKELEEMTDDLRNVIEKRNNKIVELQQDSKTNAEIVEKIKSVFNNKYFGWQEKLNKIESILKETK